MDDTSGFTGSDGFPWYVKALLAVSLLVILFIVVIDLFELAGAA